LCAGGRSVGRSSVGRPVGVGRPAGRRRSAVRPVVGRRRSVVSVGGGVAGGCWSGGVGWLWVGFGLGSGFGLVWVAFGSAWFGSSLGVGDLMTV